MKFFFCSTVGGVGLRLLGLAAPLYVHLIKVYNKVLGVLARAELINIISLIAVAYRRNI